MGVWRILTAPFRALWHLVDPDTHSRWGIAFNSFVERRLGVRATLLPAAIFTALMALALLLIRKEGDPIPWVVALLSLSIAVYIGGIYVIRLVNGEGGLEPRGLRGVHRRPPPSGIRAWFDRFGSPAQRLARRGDVSGLMALATDGSSKDRADAVNRLWGLLDRLSSSERDHFELIARSAIGDRDAGVRAQAVFAVGALKEASDVDDLEAALDDADWLVRLAAAYALSWQEPPAAITSIARLLDDPEPMVRDQGTEILRVVAAGEDQAARSEAVACLDAAGLALR